MENYDAVNAPVPTADKKKAAVNGLAGSALKCGILAYTVPWCINFTTNVVTLVLRYGGYTPQALLEGVIRLADVVLFIHVLTAVFAVVFGIRAWKRGNLARAGAIDLGIRPPAKAAVGKVFGIIAIFSYAFFTTLRLLSALNVFILTRF